MATATTRRRAPRKRRIGPVIAGVAIVVAVVLAVAVGFAACSGDDNKDAAAGTTGATDSVTALLSKALGEMNSQDLAAAKADLQQVTKVDPQNKYAYYNLGYIAQTKNEASNAESQYKLALAVDPGYDPALYNLAILRSSAGDRAGAITLYQQAIASNPKDANANFNLGLLLRQTGHIAAGNAKINTAVQLDSSLKAAATAQGIPVG